MARSTLSASSPRHRTSRTRSRRQSARRPAGGACRSPSEPRSCGAWPNGASRAPTSSARSSPGRWAGPARRAPNEIRRGFQERALYLCSIAEEALADLQVQKKEGFERFIRREPHGVVLVVAPWNYPWLTSVNAVVPALLAGNSVILKMAAQTPLVAERYAQAFGAAGLPQGVFQFLHMDHDEHRADDRRCAHRLCRVHRLGRRAGTPCSAPRPSASSAPASSLAARTRRTCAPTRRSPRRSRTSSTAASSIPASRAARSSASTCTARSSSRSSTASSSSRRQYRLGNPLEAGTTLGPMVRTGAADSVRAQIRDAVQQGARKLLESEGSGQARPICRRKC